MGSVVSTRNRIGFIQERTLSRDECIGQLVVRLKSFYVLTRLTNIRESEVESCSEKPRILQFSRALKRGSSKFKGMNSRGGGLRCFTLWRLSWWRGSNYQTAGSRNSTALKRFASPPCSGCGLGGSLRRSLTHCILTSSGRYLRSWPDAVS